LKQGEKEGEISNNKMRLAPKTHLPILNVNNNNNNLKGVDLESVFPDQKNPG
jgi:hypothetical protein